MQKITVQTLLDALNKEDNKNKTVFLVADSNYKITKIDSDKNGVYLSVD